MTDMLLKWLGLQDKADVLRIVEAQWAAARALPEWLLWTVAAVGLALAMINFLPQIGMRRSIRALTFGLRLAMVAVLLIVLVGLQWHVVLDLAQPQQWVVLIDDSASMATADVPGGASRYAAALGDAEKLRRGLGSSVDLSIRSFSGEPLGDAPGKGPTHFQQVLTSTVLSRQSVDRVILLTDGRDSDGRNLEPVGRDLRARGVDLSARVYGETARPRDTGIFAEPARSVIRLGERLQVLGAIVTDQQASFTVLLKENGKQVKSQAVPPEQLSRFEIDWQPESAGRHTYTVEVVTDDALQENNISAFIVDVVEEKIKVLLLEGYPRFEFKLFKSVLEVDPLVQLVAVSHLPGGGVYVQGEALHSNAEQGLISSQAELFKYDVVVLRDIPRAYFREGGDATETRLQHIVDFVTKRGGGLMVTGGSDVYRAGGYETSHLLPILPFDLSDSVGTDAQFQGMFYVDIPRPAYQHALLQLLPKAADNRERLNSLRQLDGSNNVGRAKPMASVLLTRVVTLPRPDESVVERESPILAAMAVGDGKVVASAVDTMWRWQLQPEFEDPPLTMLLANTIRWLAPPPAKRPDQPNVAIDGAMPQVGRDLHLTTVLRDKNFDPIREAELLVTVTRPDESTLRIFPRDLPEEPGIYRYQVPVPMPGGYTVEATFGAFSSSRHFLAGAAAGEFANLSADMDGMKALAAAANGQLIASIDTFIAKVDRSPTPRTVERELDVWNSVPLLLLFLLLVSLDCYLRKRQGLA